MCGMQVEQFEADLEALGPHPSCSLLETHTLKAPASDVSQVEQFEADLEALGPSKTGKSKPHRCAGVGRTGASNSACAGSATAPAAKVGWQMCASTPVGRPSSSHGILFSTRKTQLRPHCARVVELEGYMHKHGEHVKKLEQARRGLGLVASWQE